MRAKRDMSRREFDAVLRRRDWQKVLCWIEIETGSSIGMVLINGKINYRASIARAVRASEEKQRSTGA